MSYFSFSNLRKIGLYNEKISLCRDANFLG